MCTFSHHPHRAAFKSQEGEELTEAAKLAKMTSCSVDTASLDGESNLKKFNAVSPDIAQIVQDDRRVSGL